MQTRRGNGKFNSTMKNVHQNYSPGNKQGNYSNYNNSDNFSKNWSPQQNKFNRRRLQRYRCQSRWPKHDIKFEYNSRDKNMMGNLKRTINYMKKVHRTGKQQEGSPNSSTEPLTRLVKITLPQYPLQRFRPS